jgi:DNA-binding IclR family transcriptional regulator
MPAKGEKYFFISSLAKGLKVLEALSECKALTVSQVASRLAINRATSHRLLATLRELGYAEKDENDRYYLTLKVLEMGMGISVHSEVSRIARLYMQELSLAFNETVNLGYFDGRDIFHLDKIDSKEILRMDSELGSRAPAYCTALGKAVLAFLPAEELNDYLARTKLHAFTENTVTSKKQLRKELDEIRKNGFSRDHEELAYGLRCVAVPVFDHSDRPSYAISLSGPSMRMTEDRVQAMQVKIQQVSRRLSQKMRSKLFAEKQN